MPKHPNIIYFFVDDMGAKPFRMASNLQMMNEHDAIVPGTKQEQEN
ncbi:MAG: hypothetical protein R6V56_08385 [Lentisphaeria bacterium]